MVVYRTQIDIKDDDLDARKVYEFSNTLSDMNRTETIRSCLILGFYLSFKSMTEADQYFTNVFPNNWKFFSWCSDHVRTPRLGTARKRITLDLYLSSAIDAELYNACLDKGIFSSKIFNAVVKRCFYSVVIYLTNRLEIASHGDDRHSSVTTALECMASSLESIGMSLTVLSQSELTVVGQGKSSEEHMSTASEPKTTLAGAFASDLFTEVDIDDMDPSLFVN
ncbi:hypothetical protein ABMX62_20435 [Vibrio vulnificus]|uniref:hypothetical protein n=1 Tax=Vibrio vulnificus TaxID=672 RepID=UPI00405A23FE